MQDPATVLYLHSSAGLYGADVQLALIVRTIDRERFRPVVILPFRGELERELSVAGAEVVIRPLAVLRRRFLRPFGLARLALGVRRDRGMIAGMAREHGARLIHANTSVVLGALPGARRAGIPLVQHVREIYPGPRALSHPIRRRIAKADTLVCVSQAVAAQFGHAPVVHDGLPRAIELSRRPEDRDRLGIDRGAFVVALIGRISGWKGHDVLARALVEPEMERRRVVAIIAGEPFPGEEMHRDRLLGLAHELGVADRLRLVGFREDLDTVLGAADAVCVPSTAPDPLPNSALEAAAAGRPVVATNSGGLPDIVKDGKTGLLIPPKDPAALAGALERIASDPALGRRLGASAAADVRARFSPTKMTAAIESVYDRLLRETSS